jgi:lactate dehydrogenase-like 2-hydroxyacid dehydrogenase
MTRPVLLMLNPIRPFVEPALAPYFEIHHLGDDADEVLAEVGPRVRAVTGFGARVSRAMMERLPQLEIISTSSVGYDGIDVAAAAERGVVVTNTPDVLTEEVADLAVGLLLATLREIPAADRYVRDARWPAAPYPLTASLRGRKVGILGLGRIGHAIARRLEGFGVPISYHGRRPQEGVAYRYFDSLTGLAGHVDVLIAVTPGGAATRHIVDSRVFAALGPDGVFVNVARGSVVDEDALIEALTSGTIRAAGLDVFADEPRVPDALRALPNTVLLPHVASASVTTRDAMAQLAVDNLIAWAEGRPPLTPVPETALSGVQSIS